MKLIQRITAYYILLLLSLTLCVLLFSCASMATLTGGEKDTKPPVIVKTKPFNLTKNFKERDIKIYFNEYFQLQSPTDNIIITPTLTQSPDYIVQGKTLVIHFNEDLLPNTTYTVTMADAVKDITEGNMLPAEQFVFSTGESLDSCIIAGKIKNAFTKLPQEKIAVMLYETDNDSAPMLQNPVYYTYTNKNGDFQFYNLPNRSFLLFALKDNNLNKKFDLPDEEIAFSDTLVHSYPIPKKIKDSIQVINKELIDSNRIQLLLFTERDTALKYLRRTMVRDGNYQFVFSSEIYDFQLIPIHSSQQISYLYELNKNKDTLSLFFIDYVNEDIDFLIQANGKNFDTVTINPSAKKQTMFRRNVNDSSIIKHNTLKPAIIHAGELNSKLLLVFDYPVKNVDLSKWLFLEKRKDKKEIILKNSEGQDSLVVEVPNYDTIAPSCYFLDSMHRKWEIDYRWKYNREYVLFCKDSVFISYNQTYNDTIKVEFKTKTPRDYGEIKLSYKVENEGNYNVQLLNEKGECLDESFISSDTTIVYSYLIAGKYQVRLINDANKNYRWDTGKYIEHRQPEKVYYFSKVIDLKSNWTVEEIFSIN